MLKRRLVFLLAGVAALSACKRNESESASKKPTPPPARLTIVTDRTALTSLALLPLDEARRARIDVFRLRPDRRFLIALGELELLVRRTPRVRLHLSWTGDAWRIDSSGAQVGAVPEMATFSDMRRVLSSWSADLVGPAAARGQVARVPVAELAELRSVCDRFESESATRALRKVDALWPRNGLPDPELAALGGRAFAQLSVMGLDTLELADLLRARALAMFALAGALGRPPETSDEALLAATLGYGPDAILLARPLPDDAPVRLFVEGRTEPLVAIAEGAGADRQTRYLALLSLASRRDTAAWSRFQEAQFGHEGFSLPVLRAAADVRRFEMDSGLGSATIYAAVEDLSPPPSAPSPDAEPVQPFGLAQEVVDRFIGAVRSRQQIQSAGLVRQFESSLAKTSANASGPIWDTHAIRAWHRAAFYSGLHLLGRRYLDQLGTVAGTRDFAAYLQGSPEGPASQFAQWYGDLSAVLSGGQVSDRHFDDLITLTALGGASVRRMADELGNTYYRGREASAIVAERVAGRLDARPANVAFMQKIAASTLWDFRMVDRLCRGWLERGWTDNSDLGTTSHCLWFTGDTAQLTALLSDRKVDVLLRGEILWRYALSPNASDAVCRARFAELAVESGYAEVVMQGWSYYLRTKQKDYAGAQRSVEAWLAHHDHSAGLIWYVFRGRLAGLMSLQGKNAEAWRVIQPALESGQGSVMTWGANILMRLGRLDEAYKLARETVDRYPNGAESRAVLAEILWRQKRYSEAAFVVDPPEEGYKVGYGGFRDELAPRFSEVFAKAPDEAALAAVAALQGQGVHPRWIAFLIPPIAEMGRNDLAFRMQSALVPKYQHLWDVAEWKLQGFGYLEKARGRSEAVAWLQGAIPKAQRETSLESFFNAKAWALLWDAVPEAEGAGQSEWAWLLRAGAATVDPATSAERGAGLLEHYRDPKAGDPTRAIGRHLMGLESREGVLAAATSPIDRCKAAYFFGLQDIASGRYEEASDWYQLVHNTCGDTWAWRLTSFAGTTLGQWYSDDENLRAEAARHAW